MSSVLGNVSRRDALKLGGVGALTVAGASMLATSAMAGEAPAEEEEDGYSFTHSDLAPTGTCMYPDKPLFLNDAPDIPESEIGETLEADVVVCGAGIAGVCAVREACESGLSVILLEKCEGVQGRSGDFGALNAKCAERYNMTGFDTVEVTSEMMKEAGYKADYMVIKSWADNSGDCLDWYFDALPDMPYLDSIASPQPDGAEYWVQPERYPLPEAWPGNDDEYYKCYQTTIRMYPEHTPCLQANLDLADATGNLVTARWYTPAVKLVTDASGAVTGVIAHDDANGTYVQANASMGVILATGDYSGNKDMLYYYCPDQYGMPALFPSFDYFGTVANTGDGHCMGMQIGAAMDTAPHAPNAHNMGGCMGSSCFLQLNKWGKRFMNEDIPGQQVEDQIELQPGHYAYQIFDGNWMNEIPYFKPEHGACCYVLPEGMIYSGEVNDTLTAKDSFAYPEQIEEAVESGGCLMADTLEGLFDLIGEENIDKEAALASVEHYNELAAAGEDTDFGKKSSRLFALDTPPFYAVKFGLSALLVCLGGLVSDEGGHAYNTDHELIPGLYLAGNTQGSRFKVQYPTCVPGQTHSSAMTSGRLAARQILADNA